MGYMENYKKWCEDTYFDEATRAELKAIEGNDKEIQERFYKDLEFGTGGLRGIIGAGTNRLNIYTVSKATQGFANYIIKQGEEAVKKGVAIAFDSRRMSPEFAEITALVLNGNGIKTYIYPSLRPTPMLSFAVRELNCTGGVVITASHNPPEYNGYKVYWADGGQVPYPRDEAIIEEVNAVTDFHTIKTANKDEAVKAGLFNVIGEEVDEAFDKNVLAQIVNPEIIKEQHDLKIVYTPIHGSGNKPVRRVLKKAGFENVTVVPEQELPDSEFTTVGYPNPENPAVFELAIKLAEKIDADIILGTDPDCDRVGAVVKTKDGSYTVLTGNMTGTLICNYICSQKAKLGTLPKNGALVSTIVSSEMTKAIAKKYNLAYFDVLTGFKYIGEKIKEFEQTGEYQYVFGFEESYGCLSGTYARDKDAVVASLLICEMAAYYKSRGMSLYDGLMELYDTYGVYKEIIHSITLKGIEGIENMKKIMDTLRKDAPSEIAGVKVTETRDYLEDKIVDVATGKVSPTNLPKSNVLYFTLADDTWFCVRPSGTEPKIKIYFGTKADTVENAEKKIATAQDGIMKVVNSVLGEFRTN
ncbi:phosphoglucomutase/phosphomannomutase alpha/beta/alpha domain I [Eubacterium sp. CAG:274]|nr:phosphoglucomutase/phosphomannomutase alpha/beta/alpha domain I [Eubacterium sp. CAG:274]